MTRILMVDDDTELSSMLGEYLTAESFDVEHAYDGRQGVEMVLTGEYGAVILDVMMPELDGFEVLRRIRTVTSVPVLMLTAKGDDIDRIVGLEIGADDYLPKPFNPRELLARLNAVLRRTQANASVNTPPGSSQRADQQPLHIGRLTLNSASRSALVDDQLIELTSTEFNLLQVLVKHVGTVVTKESLSEHAMGRRLEKYDRSIDMHMSNLRKKMSERDVGSMIITVRGQGYQLSGDG